MDSSGAEKEEGKVALDWEEKEEPDGERVWEETNEEGSGYMEAITVGRMEGRN